MLKKLFPYKMQLHIFQLEGYDIRRFLVWISHNFLKRSYIEKKPLVRTSKVRFISVGAVISFIVLAAVFVKLLGYFGLVLALFLSTQTWMFIIMGLLLLKPYEVINKYRTKRISRAKIRSLKTKGLKVIGITGSYGKTSVKEFLYQILRGSFKVLRTPESYNTLFGVAKVVDYELDEYYDFFICEMGAYKIGEIRELCETFCPDHAILTGINEQHIERFGKIENTIRAKFEIMQYLDSSGVGLVSGANELVMENFRKYKENAVVYGASGKDYYIKDVVTNRTGSYFELVLAGKSFTATTSLVGNSNLENILATASMACLLGVTPEKIILGIEQLQPVPHRLEIKSTENGLTVIDDSYNSNITGFKVALDLLESFEDMEKILVTPGIVELGDKTYDTHIDLGSKANKICDKVLLVGKSDRTIALQEGIDCKEKVVFIDSLMEMPFHIENPQNSVVLIENDLTENY